VLDLRILIVEDNIVNQKVALHQLQKLGCLADSADNGRLALDAIQKAPYDLVFMDCQMPELDGYEATRELRRIEGSERHTWVVAMTAHSLEGDREKCLAAGMDDYVSKPVKPDDLAGALRRFHEQWEARNTEAGMHESGSGAIDRSLLDGFRDLDQEGEESILGRLIDLFLENTPSVLKEAHAALDSHSSPLLARAAHTLKGSCSNFGADRMRDACLELELEANKGELGRAAELLGRVEREFSYVRFALERERPQRAA
jgi:CheY-like chemotaxis protein